MLRFDIAYYKRFYGDNGTHDAEKIAHLATAVHHLAAWWGINITSVLDVGAGMGMWRDMNLKQCAVWNVTTGVFVNASYVGCSSNCH